MAIANSATSALSTSIFATTVSLSRSTSALLPTPEMSKVDTSLGVSGTQTVISSSL
uniref:Uncharacterized protein n=1 Tax=Moniliophthora roreri TaxID=221103 RepID=A0A0W0G1T8_MONRR